MHPAGCRDQIWWGAELNIARVQGPPPHGESEVLRCDVRAASTSLQARAEKRREMNIVLRLPHLAGRDGGRELTWL